MHESDDAAKRGVQLDVCECVSWSPEYYCYCVSGRDRHRWAMGRLNALLFKPTISFAFDGGVGSIVIGSMMSTFSMLVLCVAMRIGETLPTALLCDGVFRGKSSALTFIFKAREMNAYLLGVAYEITSCCIRSELAWPHWTGRKRKGEPNQFHSDTLALQHLRMMCDVDGGFLGLHINNFVVHCVSHDAPSLCLCILNTTCC